MAKQLNTREAKFIAFLQADPDENATQAVIKAGYSVKSAGQIAYQLMRKPKIIAELSAWKASKRKDITKTDYIDLAINDYKSLEVEHPNKPRFLDIAGKALGYTSNKEDNTKTTNNTINVVSIGSMPLDQLRELIRRQIQSE